MRSIELHKTSIAGVWRLSNTGCRRTPSVDPIQDAGLTRRRWPFLQTVWWSIHPSGEITFAPETTGCQSLRQMCDEKMACELDGDMLFQKVLAALDTLRNHLFSFIVELLVPDLIFVSSGSQPKDIRLSLVTLPFPDLALQTDEDVDESIIDQINYALPDWFAETFDWNDETFAANRLAWRARLTDVNDILSEPFDGENQDCKTSLPKEREQNTLSYDDQPLQSHHPKADQQYKETGLLKSFFRRLLGYGDQLFEEESTEDLDLSSNALRVASLSEGLPGTPDEEEGRHAFILTDAFLIGRDIRKADFPLDDPGVSRIHARITRSGGHFFIEDMGSRNGTTVDGIKLKKHTVQLLPEMCRIAFGDAVFYFRSD